MPDSNGTTLCSFDFPPLDGGIARLCAATAEGLSAAGAPVHVLTQAAPPSEARETATADAGARSTIERVTSLRPLRELAMLRRLRRRRGPVLCGTWYPEGLLAAIAGVEPLVILAHGSELMPARSRLRRPLWRRLLRWTLDRADLVAANSAYTERLVRECAPACRVVGIPLAVDPVRFAPGDRLAARSRLGVSGKKVVLTVARLERYKGHDLVLRALSSFPEDLRGQFVYLVAGKGPDREWLEQEARRLGVQDQLRLLGHVPDEELPALYQAADLFVLCTRESAVRQEVEGFGLAFLEAQACGTPVVGSRTGGIADAVREGEGGWLIGPDDGDALGGLLRRLAADPESFGRAGADARARVERECAWSRYIERLVSEASRQGVRLV